MMRTLLQIGMVALLALACSGCQGWGAKNESLRQSDLTPLARKARTATSEEKEKSKENDDPRLSDRANQISRDLQ
jgi:hypothetical protein